MRWRHFPSRPCLSEVSFFLPSDACRGFFDLGSMARMQLTSSSSSGIPEHRRSCCLRCGRSRIVRKCARECRRGLLDRERWPYVRASEPKPDSRDRHLRRMSAIEERTSGLADELGALGDPDRLRQIRSSSTSSTRQRPWTLFSSLSIVFKLTAPGPSASVRRSLEYDAGRNLSRGAVHAPSRSSDSAPGRVASQSFRYSARSLSSRRAARSSQIQVKLTDVEWSRQTSA